MDAIRVRTSAGRVLATLVATVVALLLVALPAAGQAHGRAGGPPDTARGAPEGVNPGAKDVRVVSYNLLDVRTEDVKRDDNPRLQELAATIQRLRPDIILLNELAYDQHEGIDVDPDDPEGRNAERFARNYLAKPQEPGLQPIRYNAFMAPSNTGIHSGHDLNNNDLVVDEYCDVPGTEQDGSPGEQLQCGRDWGDDSFGFGTFPGQYAMGLLVRPQLKIQHDDVRTFQELLWADMPGALLPSDPDDPDFDPANPEEGDQDWYTEEELAIFRLSSKSHWDVPVRIPGGEVLHVLASHPTPPGFDGEEARNALRNHDEVRFWGDYIDDAEYIYDDDGETGGLDEDASFVVVGDLNADDDPGGDEDSDTFGDPVGDYLLSNDRVNGDFVPEAREQADDLKADATADFGIRADYVLPSSDLIVEGGEVYGHSDLYEGGAYGDSPSDHYPVVVDLEVPKHR